jgi:hypothetical protein
MKEIQVWVPEDADTKIIRSNKMNYKDKIKSRLQKLKNIKGEIQ